NDENGELFGSNLRNVFFSMTPLKGSVDMKVFVEKTAKLFNVINRTLGREAVSKSSPCSLQAKSYLDWSKLAQDFSKHFSFRKFVREVVWLVTFRFHWSVVDRTILSSKHDICG